MAAIQRVQREVRTVQAHIRAPPSSGPYRHYMQKEIFEQPRAIADTLDGVGGLDPSLFGDHANKVFDGVDRVLILACGTSYYAGSTAPLLARGASPDCRPRWRSPANTATARACPTRARWSVTISQSGETADTIAALKHARSLGMERTLTICNVATSAMVRECKLAFITRAGVEIGVASTKAFTTQLVALFLLTLGAGQVPRQVAREGRRGGAAQPAPPAVGGAIGAGARAADHQLGRGLRAARSTRSFSAADGTIRSRSKVRSSSRRSATSTPRRIRPANSKHGPLALVDAEMPVVTVAPADDLLEKLKSNMQEVRARGSQLYVFADADTRIEVEHRHPRDPSARALRRAVADPARGAAANCSHITPPWPEADVSTSHATSPSQVTVE